MAEVQLFSLGYWLVALSIGVSVIGMLVGLACAVNGRRSKKFRPVWLVAAAAGIGGVGLWLSTAISLLGISVPGGALRYDVTLLIVSLVVVVLAVFTGLLTAGREFQLPRMLGGATVIGIGGGVMVYLDLLALDVQGTAELTLWLIVVAGVVAVLAANLCLWLFQVFRFTLARVGTIALFAAGVSAIYYIGVAGLKVSVDKTGALPEGQELFGFVFPMFVIGMLALAAPISAVLVAPDRREFAATSERNDRKGSGDSGSPRRDTAAPVNGNGGSPTPEPAR